MPTRLRPKAPVARDAILVGDPGRSLLLAQELLEEPRMSNHARGLWGYSGQTAAGAGLTIQATGMGGPSAAVVVADLAKLGVRRAVRVGTCAGLDPAVRPGDLLVVSTAIAVGGSAGAFGVEPGGTVPPDTVLRERLLDELEGESRSAPVASVDAMPVDPSAITDEAVAADMQTVAVLARCRGLEIAAAAVLIVSETVAGDPALADEPLEAAAKRAGRAASAVLSP